MAGGMHAASAAAAGSGRAANPNPCTVAGVAAAEDVADPAGGGASTAGMVKSTPEIGREVNDDIESTAIARFGRSVSEPRPDSLEAAGALLATGGKPEVGSN